MHFFVFFLGCALLPTAFTLKCYQCAPNDLGSCTDVETDCPPKTQCGLMWIKAFVGGHKISDTTMKSCAMPGQYMSASLNLGIAKTAIGHKYCTTDLCNANVSESSGPSSNGLKCRTCTAQDCVSTLDCVGSEDRCASATMDTEGQKTTMKGCASEMICSGAAAAMVPGMDVKCCEGNLCNSAQSFGPSFILLPVACALSVTLFN